MDGSLGYHSKYSNTLLVTPNGFTKGGTLVTFVTPTTRRHFIVDQNLNPIQPGGGRRNPPPITFSQSLSKVIDVSC